MSNENAPWRNWADRALNGMEDAAAEVGHLAEGMAQSAWEMAAGSEKEPSTDERIADALERLADKD